VSKRFMAAASKHSHSFKNCMMCQVHNRGKDARPRGVKLKGRIAKLNTDLVVLSDKG